MKKYALGTGPAELQTSPQLPLRQTEINSPPQEVGAAPHSHVVEQPAGGGRPLRIPLDGVHLILQHSRGGVRPSAPTGQYDMLARRQWTHQWTTVPHQWML